MDIPVGMDVGVDSQTAQQQIDHPNDIAPGNSSTSSSAKQQPSNNNMQMASEGGLDMPLGKNDERLEKV